MIPGKIYISPVNFLVYTFNSQIPRFNYRGISAVLIPVLFSVKKQI